MAGAPGPGDFHTWGEMAARAEKEAKKADAKGDKETARRRREQAKHFRKKRRG